MCIPSSLFAQISQYQIVQVYVLTTWAGRPGQQEERATVQFPYGVAEAEAVALGVSERAVPPSASWAGRPRRQEG